MSKKKYLAPQISIILFEPQAILAGSGEASTPGDFTYDNEITSGDEEEGIWEQKI